ncbi:MAG: bifunctional aspartate kinase/homoserine dehydrogenase I, partial [Bacteroidota bacterium]|nr:bifunctional aspartate kinase/homoserine dehydrogenase I [Bacteroidota bacterium]
MQVLKFGGSSVANAENINNVVSIVQQSLKKNNNIIIVLSALGGTTDALLEAAIAASHGDVLYKEKLHSIEHRHLTTVKELIPLDQQSSILSMVKKRCNDIEDICNGVFLLKELSNRTKDSVISYGELLSSQIFFAKLKSLNIDNTWKDSRELIITDSEFGT